MFDIRRGFGYIFVAYSSIHRTRWQLDDQGNHTDRERQKLLEEIRRRAEEAELKRIEEEEQRADLLAKPPSPEPLKSSPPPPPETSRPSLSRNQEKIEDLREKFDIAIDRAKVDKAAELLDEMRLLDVDPDEIAALRERLHALRKQQDDSKAKKRAADQHAKETAAQERAKRESQQKKVTDLLQKANDFYQREKYDRGLETLDELLTLETDNDEARQLVADITKAKDLAQRVREEEAKRRAEEAALTPPRAAEATPPPQTPGEIWGSKETPPVENEMGLPEVAEQVAPPKPPLVERVIDRLSKVHIPLKPVLIGIGVLTLAVVAWVIITQLKEAVFPPKYSLLVLPATSMNSDSSGQFLSEAVTEDLINTVSVVTDLRVVGIATSLSLRTYTGDFSPVARSLGASYYLQWTASKSADRVAFQVTLFDTLSADPVWSMQYQNSVRELQSVTKEIGRAVIREMKVPTNPQEDESFAGLSNTSGEAYDDYARGRWYVHRMDAASIDRAITSFGAALDKDSLFVEARLGMAWAHLLAADREIESPGTHVQLAWKYLNEALALGGHSSESYRIRGLIAQDQQKYDRALEELERAVAIAPSDAESQRRLAVIYVIKGRTDDAMKAANRALADDPRNVESYLLPGMIHLLRDEGRDALQDLEAGMRYAPDKSAYASSVYADVLEYTHQPDRAAQILTDRAAQTQSYVDYYKLGRFYQTAGRPKQQWESVLGRAKALLTAAGTANTLDAAGYSYLALTETRLGSFKDALEANAHARRLAPDNLDVLYNTARMYALQTDKTQALDYLRKAIDIRFRFASLLDMDFYNLRSEPEFLPAITR